MHLSQLKLPFPRDLGCPAQLLGVQYRLFATDGVELGSGITHGGFGYFQLVRSVAFGVHQPAP